MDRIKVICVVGPTASGKTSLAVKLALALEGEVVSADSMQIYRGMTIATAKPTPEEAMGVPHRMIDFLDPCETYSVAQYTKEAHFWINDISARGRTPIVAGGTGLYIDSLLSGTDFAPLPDNSQIRSELRLRMETQGGAALLEELRRIDPQRAAQLHENNRGRIVRALEIYYLTGETMTETLKKSREKPSPYDVLYIGIAYEDRQRLYDRIDKRVDIMVEAGLLNEAREYISLAPDATARQAIGYKELAPYFKGDCSLDEALESLKRETRRYAKRQLTWFRRNENINWFYPDTDRDFGERALEKAREFLKEN